MARIELLGFQQKAADQLVDAAVSYFSVGQDTFGGRPVPFVGQLKAVTGAGKTPILANVVSRLKPALILWTTKYGVVVDQTVSNLRGKYRHLLGSGNVEIVNFADITSSSQWEYLLERKDGLTIIVSTVAGWNSSEKDERLNVHRPCPDWGERTRWDRLKLDRQRPLWVVYDEAHNTTTEQVELLDDLNPAGFFVASASQIKGRLQFYLSSLPQEIREKRIAPIKTRDVVDAELLKSTISLADYASPAEEMIVDVVKRREDLEKGLKSLHSSVVPKAIYVVEASNSRSKDSAESRPAAIWRTLVNICKIEPENIAVCTNTKDLPRDALRVANINQLSEKFTHVIFNKKLQEGWDDPSVYICYFDGSTQSATRIQQVLGRAVRQPNISHFSDEALNTAYFFFNCPSDLLEKIIDDLKEELRIYKSDEEPGFEPFEFKQDRRAVSKIPLKNDWQDKLRVPNLQPEMPAGDSLDVLIRKKTFDFSDEDRAARGRALINVVSVATGDVSQAKRNLLEDMRVRCGTFLYEAIRTLSKNCVSAIHPASFSNSNLDKSACYNSKALEHYREVAQNVVNDYENHVRLSPLVDPEQEFYVVGSYQPTGSVEKHFKNAGHPFYDTNAFRADELEVAKGLDKFDDAVWVRNKDRLDYGIPLPVKSGSSSTFYPDFLWWVNETVWAIDPTGKFILNEKIRTKMLTVPLPLRIALLTRGHLNASYNQVGDGGWSLVRFRLGNAAPENFETLDAALAALKSES
jgi:type III restriction enzyme